MKIPSLKRLLIEDFPNQDKGFLGSLFYIINQGFEFLTLALNKNLTFEDNMRAQIKEIKVTAPLSNPIFVKNELGLPCKDIWITNVTNVSDTTYLSAAPFIQFDNVANQIRINSIVGLSAGKTYIIRFICQP
jgi:hypothetical protein